MKRKYKVILLLVALILISIGGAGYYISRQIGEMDSSEERNIKYSKYSYYSSDIDEFVSPEELVYYPEQTTGGDPGFLRFFMSSPNAPEFELPKHTLTRKDFSETPSDYAAYWLGHSTVIIELDGQRILIDPVFENAGPFPGITRRFGAAPLSREELPDIDIVLITHDHYDHLEMATMQFLADKDVQFIAPLSVGTRLRGWGVPERKVTELGWNQSISFGSLNIVACPTVHYSGRSNNDRNKTLWVSYVIRGEEKNIYWSGDTGYGDHFKEIGDHYGPFDLAFVEIDAWNRGWPNTHLFPNEVIQVSQDLNTKLLFPIHLGTFDLALHPWDESIDRVVNLASEENIKIVIPIMGQKVIPGITPTTKWWIR
ncbi:MBL fold metallo-hydrolase [Autumnicola psychrophila]|uniref:MBL fold metallo-hydrolase n=1 Tax=Autumnicola psychrophila TaxID=3075592 RepID=A0ABU3DQM5_9FLAO|nr:MBL fold metallo-hydrolase [Zunongwangia sp. F225]MDT0686004.1 MBL fold metallo-hydrolase [Zunongwangia sp. F225]